MRYLTALACLVATPAMAAPVYLECTLPATTSGASDTVYQVTADEANGVVTTLLTQTGNVQRTDAVFTPTSVRWNTPFAGVAVSFELSRTDLTLVRDMKLMNNLVHQVGPCKLQTAPKRAF